MVSPHESRRSSKGSDRRTSGQRSRPPALRTQSEAVPDDKDISLPRTPTHARHKSTSTSNRLARLSAEYPQGSASPRFSGGGGDDSPLSPRQSPEFTRDRTASSQSDKDDAADTSGSGLAQDLIPFDFTRIDYELERARSLGSGAWSTVVLAESRVPQSSLTAAPDNKFTPPRSPPRPLLVAPAAVFAVKLPSRGDAGVVLKHEAKILSHLHAFAGVSQYVVTFYGMDFRNNAIVSEAVLGGSMDDLTSRLRHMTDYARHQEVVSLFPSLSLDLVSGLEFLHHAGIVHADIKPSNILLDISDHYSLPAPVIRARYIDFSASFMPAIEDSMPAGGGTWDFMAPEQLRAQKDLSRPTLASDIWSLGITLLYVIILGSPYTAASNGNVFMLREAIKSGDPLAFARTDMATKERMDACQSFIDACRLALQKDRDRRVSAAAWRRWLEDQNA